MPHLLATNEIKLEWSDVQNRIPKKRPKSASKRSTGVHLSGVIQYCLGLGGDKDPDEMPLNMAAGVFMEDGLVTLWPKLKWQPGEQKLDGIYGSPDGRSAGVDVAPQLRGMDVVEEFKCTWKSQHNYGDILAQTAWIWQGSGYCCMMGLRHVRYHIFWVNGNYRPPSPKYITYLVEFTEEELERFWLSVVLRNKDCVKREEHG